MFCHSVPVDRLSAVNRVPSIRKATIRIRLIAVATVVIVLLFSASSQAANVIVGDPVLPVGSNSFYSCDVKPCLYVNIGVPTSVGTSRSPVDGAVVGWNVDEVSPGFGYQLLVLHQVGETQFYDGSFGPVMNGAGASAPVTDLNGRGTQSFETDLPIKVGDYIGLITPVGSGMSAFSSPGFTLGFPWLLSDGTYSSGVFPGQLPFNAEVQPAPTITMIGATSGAAGGGTSVTIGGTEFANVSAVKFGANAAASYTVDSEGQITAASPAGPAGSVPITVTTIAGMATSSQQFTYQAPTASNPTAMPEATPAPISASVKTCTVPKLAGKTLKDSRATIRDADCKVGRVKKRKGTRATTGKVVGQSKRPGTVLPAGTVIKLTLGKG
jgi:hypothetical protein